MLRDNHLGFFKSSIPDKLNHAEDIRDIFVAHEGKETIYVEDFTWCAVIHRFAGEIQSRVETDWLLDWIMPDFSTSTESDYMTVSALMMDPTPRGMLLA
ncbi:uncharacterized protein MKZ38_004419 [Zalerion maritima]|uniref:Uncharacterized protein n=1 Tax=Zalerion maritima TaxID=339359 RepID=A0AAD5RMQ8_9PEZI|nr:uncharacterized protein MKZ38_004419 [Zalerion maritima]